MRAWIGALVLALAGCAEAAPALPEGSQPTTITVSEIDFWLEPHTIVVQAGEPVRVLFANPDRIAHGIRFELQGGEPFGPLEPVAPGEFVEFEFVAPSVLGQYDYYCPLEGHAQRGAHGTLLVASPPTPGPQPMHLW